MNVYFIPNESRENKYIENMLKCLEDHDIYVVNKDKSNRFYSMMFWTPIWVLSKKVQIFHFNWILGMPSQSIIRDYIATHSFMIWMKILQLLGCKFVWTMHNKVPHDAKNMKLALKYRSFLAKNVDKIIIHCNQTKNLLKSFLTDDEIKNKVAYIPHGNYINAYINDDNNLKKKLGISEKDLVFMFLGQIRPYKNIDILIKSFNELNLPNAKLLICGEAINEEYKKTIFELIVNNKNIMFIPQFVPDEKIVTYLNTADILVLPYNKDSILNSGAMLLAFSYKTPVIIPDICSAVDIGTDKKFLFTYSYSTENEHCLNLKNKLYECNYIFKADPNCFKTAGEDALEYVKLRNNWDSIGNQLNDMYNDLISR